VAAGQEEGAAALAQVRGAGTGRDEAVTREGRRRAAAVRHWQR
jgi:hypothetical protein